MAQHVAEDPNLDQLAAQAVQASHGLLTFALRYQIDLRLN